MRLRQLLIVGCCLLASGLSFVSAQDMTPTPMPDPDAPQPATITGSTFITEVQPFSDDLLERLTLPEGFEISVFARDLGSPRVMAISDAGVIYISRRGEGDVVALFDQNMDGVPDTEGFRVIAADLNRPHGLVIRDNRLYIAGEKEIWVADIMEDGSLGELETIAENLPDGDQHTWRTMAFGPDGELYVNLGSSCNACMETNPENAAIVRVPLDGSERTVVADGLRNSLGFGWQPETGALWAFDHGSDWRGDDQPPEELNQIQEGGNYGWPFCFGSQQVDVYIPYSTESLYGVSNEEYCTTMTSAPVIEYQAHSAPINFLFYTGSQFPEEFVNDAFVTMRGSWNRYPATGYKVVRIHFGDDGQPTEITDFITGFLSEDGNSTFARPAGLVMMADGSLLVSDDTNGMIYRVTYTGMQE